MSTRHDESGMALVTALVTLMLVTVIGLSITSLGMLSVTVATNDRETNESLAIADAGLTHARALLLNQVWVAPPGEGPFDRLLQVGDGQHCSGDEFSAAPSNAGQPYPPIAELIPLAGRVHPAANTFGGRYIVRLCDDHTVEMGMTPADANPNHDENRRIMVRSRGVGRNGAEATIEALFNERPMPGLLVNGNMILNGGVEVIGTEGAVHANGNIDLDGNSMCIEKYYSSVGTITPMTAGNGGSCPYSGTPKLPGSDPIPVPKLNLSDPMWPKMSKYLLLGGSVYCGPQNTDITRCPSGVSTFNDATQTWTLKLAVGETYFVWKSSQKRWENTTKNAPGTYYADGNVSIGGNANLTLTLFAKGWVDISGSPNITPAMPSAPGGTYAIVAGTDLEINGDLLASPTFTGLYYARDQVSFGGNATVNGLVVSGNFSDCRWPLGSYVCNPNVTDTNSDNLVQRDSSGYVDTGSGSVTITYNDDSGWKALRLASWRECRGADPTNPCGNP